METCEFHTQYYVICVGVNGQYSYPLAGVHSMLSLLLTPNIDGKCVSYKEINKLQNLLNTSLMAGTQTHTHTHNHTHTHTHKHTHVY